MRLVVLILSMGSVVLYGYALAGAAGFLLGRGRWDYVIYGLLLGTASAAGALFLWKRFLLSWEGEVED